MEKVTASRLFVGGVKVGKVTVIDDEGKVRKHAINVNRCEWKEGDCGVKIGGKKWDNYHLRELNAQCPDNKIMTGIDIIECEKGASYPDRQGDDDYKTGLLFRINCCSLGT